MQNTKTIVTIIGVALVGFFLYLFQTQNTKNTETENTNNIPDNTNTENTQTNTNNEATTTSNIDANTSVKSTKYKDGTYTVNTNYFAPPGKEEVGVTLTIKDDKISAVTVKNMAADKNSINYQNKFIAGVSAAAVGKNIDNLKLSVVSGSSLTTGGFNQALVQIRAQAMN